MYPPLIQFKEIYNSSYYFFNIIQVGAGGNGGYLTQRLSKMISSFKTVSEDDFRYTIIDGDVVEQKNLSRQPFVSHDLSKYKAKVLAERYAQAYQTPIYHDTNYIESKEDVLKHLKTNQFNDFVIPIIIGCVDNNATRKVLHEVFMSMDHGIYIDSGIDSVIPDEDELSTAKTGYSGTAVCGYRHRGKTVLEPAGVVYPDILEDQESLLPTQACGVTVVNHPQRMQTNETAALVMAGYLNTILGHKHIASHYTNFNARTMLIKPTYLEQSYCALGK